MTFAISYSDLSDINKDSIDIVEADSAFDALAKLPKTTKYTEDYDRNDPGAVTRIINFAYDRDETIIIVKPVTLPGNSQA